MKERYIRQVERALTSPRARKREILRDLEEIFSSALEHGETEQAVIDRLGPPEAFAAGMEEELGSRRGRGAAGAVAGIAAAVLAVGCAAVFAAARLLRAPEEVIGGADSMTGIRVLGGFDWSWALLGLGAAAAVLAAVLLARVLARRGRGKKR